MLRKTRSIFWLGAGVLVLVALLTQNVGSGWTVGSASPWWAVGSGGNTSSSTNYRLLSTLAQAASVGISTNGTMRLESGLWNGTLDFDADGIIDSSEATCGSDSLNAASTPERVDGPFAGVSDDGDVDVDEPLPAGAEAFDCDGDGYVGTTEAHVYSYVPQTDGDQKVCGEYDMSHPNPSANTKPSLRWPSDLVFGSIPDSTNKITIGDLSSFVAPVRYLGNNVGTNPLDVRWDLSPGPGLLSVDINVLDLSALVAGSTGNPPMFGGTRAFSGPLCPWPE